ncbi:ferritin-like domain-containing protein [Actinomadura darangshiensis]|uniref:Ferritin-like domain-containing protein n=1 Tax=Actinomadura darangshiensis TaxID=705336 RepID=A0A4R5AVF2_9ACTN|nr:ferritin-like domain-containing protein [Actinomadura darangshiensis]TDD75666.1 ferritin-like domain-containing protein [Actinomadura darangshiensis]
MNAQTMAPEDELEPIWLLNQYRAAEVHGAGAIMRLGRLADGLELQRDLSRHLRDEAVHAWLWTKAITDLGGQIMEVDEPYQTMLAGHFGIPRTLDEMLALTLVSERRGVAQYEEHLDVQDIAAPIRRTLRGILKDEQWHVAYINDELERRARTDPGVQTILDRAMVADEKAMEELEGLQAERSAAHAPAGQAGPGKAPS